MEIQNEKKKLMLQFFSTDKDDYNKEFLEISQDMIGPGEHFIIRVHGDDMFKEGIKSGSLVIIKKQNYAEDGAIVAALVEGDAILRKYYKIPGLDKIRLQTSNTNNKDIIVSESNILGIAIKIIKDL